MDAQADPCLNVIWSVPFVNNLYAQETTNNICGTEGKEPLQSKIIFGQIVMWSVMYKVIFAQIAWYLFVDENMYLHEPNS